MPQQRGRTDTPVALPVARLLQALAGIAGRPKWNGQVKEQLARFCQY